MYTSFESGPDKPERVNPSVLEAREKPLKIEDLEIYANPIVTPERFAEVLEKIKDADWLEELDPDIRSFVSEFPENAFITFQKLVELYASETSQDLTRGKIETDWLANLPPDIQNFIRYQARISNFDDVIFVDRPISLAGFAYLPLEGGLLGKATDKFGLWRLAEIKQLALKPPQWREESKIRRDPEDKESIYLGYEFGMTRFTHSYDVMAIATLMTHNLGLSESERNNLQLAALTHDTLTPAGGDAVKVADPKGLDEDANYRPYLEGLDISDLAKYKIDKEKVASTVEGKGIFGQLLDIADKCAYTAKDIPEFLEAGMTSTDMGDVLSRLRNILEKRPTVCDIWSDVQIEGEEVYFSDPEKLGDFLYARTLMFKWLYYHASSRMTRTALLGELVRYFYKKGDILREDLLKMNDRQLEIKVEELTESPFIFGRLDVKQSPLVETFETEEERDKRERSFIGRKDVIVIRDKNNFSIKNTGVDKFKVRNPEGKIVPFSEYSKDMKDVISSELSGEKPYRLYILEVTPKTEGAESSPEKGTILPVSIIDDLENERRLRLGA